MTEEDSKSLKDAEKEEIVRVFVGNQVEPISVVDVPHSIARLCSNHFFQAFRLYLVPDDSTDDNLLARLRGEVQGW